MKYWESRRYENKILPGDCLQVLPFIPDKSVDMILCDLPYGITGNLWDKPIPLPALWEQYERIIKDNGAIVLTSQGRFTGQLIMSNEKLFRYKIVWIKSVATGFLNARRQPLRKHEDICIFYKQSPSYNPQFQPGKPYDPSTSSGKQTGSYGKFRSLRTPNLTGLRYPTDTLLPTQDEFGEDHVCFKTANGEGRVYHSVQKPVALGRYLIRTYTNEGDIVLDNACGCGTFLVAAILENRRFIGIERNVGGLLHKAHPIDYVKVSRKRVADAFKMVHNTKSPLKGAA